MAAGDFSAATFNLFNLNLPGKKLYSGAGWTAEEYQRKLDWTGEMLECLSADVFGFQELWHGDCLADAFGIPDGKRRRGKRTRAKERVYKHINARIREIYPGFNIGASTGHAEGIASRWLHPYRHWKFEPKGAIQDHSRGKRPK